MCALLTEIRQRWIYFIKIQKENTTVVLLYRIACLDQTIKDKTATIEALKSKVNASVSTKDRYG